MPRGAAGTIVAISIIAIGIAGCTTEQRVEQGNAQEVAPTPGQASALFADSSWDFNVLGSPAELVEQSDLALVGTIRNVTEGRSAPISDKDDSVAFSTITVEVLPGETFSGQAAEKVVHVELDRHPTVSIASSREALAGADAVFYLTDITGDEAAPVAVDPPTIWHDPEAGRPVSARIYVPISPQGLFIQTTTGVEQVLTATEMPGWTLDDVRPDSTRQLPDPDAGR